jgi:histidinol-phosphatase (PHP family)
MPNKDIVTMALPALHAIKEANMALELNVAGYRKPIGEPYPSKALLTEAYRLGIPITFASDAHKPEQVALYDKEIITFAKEVGYSECVYFKERKRFFVTF